MLTGNGPVAFRDVQRLLVKVTAGSDAPERCAQAFTVSATAVAAGADVELWLTGEASWFALPGRAAGFELPHSAPLADLLESILSAGQVRLCTQCAARREIGPGDVIPGITIAGAAGFVEAALADNVQALVY
jgi:predicted peroxiredoxin